jgi:hypothetical protein
MRIPMTAAAILFSLAASQGQRGVVSSVTATPDVSVGIYQFVVRGTNPCGAVRLTYGDGIFITHAIRDLPVSISHEYTRVGDYTVLAEGMGNCDGSATTRVRVTEVRPQPPPPPPPPPPPTQPAQPPPAPRMRFAAMDANGDGVITRAEWSGSARSFALHDWNGNGRLSGDEIRLGASPQAPGGRARGRGGQPAVVSFDWTETQFRQLDRNGDNRISRGEWRYDVEDFVRVDRNGDNQLALNEFLWSDVDDDRGDHFDDLDLNGNNRIERREWHGDLEAFRWLDRNGDGVITRVEAEGQSSGGRSDVVTDVNRGGQAAGRNTGTIIVSSRVAWTDTGLTVRAGDVLSIRATGTIQFSPSGGDTAPPDGASGRRATRNAPLPDIEIGALIARVGNSAPFFVGSATDRLRAPQGGRLYLGVNDDILRDNRGDFRVVVTVGSRGGGR